MKAIGDDAKDDIFVFMRPSGECEVNLYLTGPPREAAHVAGFLSQVESQVPQL
jgi:hypothetical protein